MTVKELKKVYKYEEIQKKFILDVQLEDYRDAYSNWDFSPYTNRDLDEDLIEYLLECSNEIPLKYDLILKFYMLNYEASQSREEKSIIGMYNYFKYQQRKLKNHKIRVIKDIVSFTLIGGVLLLVGTYLNEAFNHTLLTSVISEGFFIGGWVMLWEMFSAWFFDMKKVDNKLKHFERFSNTEIIYTYEKDA